MIAAYAYTRVSGRGQLEGSGLERQKEGIDKFAENSGFNIKQTFREEGVSGTSSETERPAFQQMVFSILRNGVNHIIIESLDRMARDLQVQIQLCTYIASKNIHLISANTGENITQAILNERCVKQWFKSKVFLLNWINH